MSWRCIVNGMGYEFLRHAQSSYLEMNLPRLEQENNQMQRRLNHFHAIQKVRKHLKEKAQERAIKSINEITALDDKRDISDFSDSSNDDFQKILPTNIRRCC